MDDRASVLAARGLTRTYSDRTWFSRQTHRPKAALRDVTLEVGKSRTLGIVGGSGAGKSTLARCLALLEPPDSGEIRLSGKDLLKLRSYDVRRARTQIQLILQGSAASLQPRFTALEVVMEPAVISGMISRAERREKALGMMERVGLPRTAASRNCSEFSGGQRQRLAIARALTMSPQVLILDESLSGLDLPVQAQIMNLLFDLQACLSMSYIFISHNIRLAAHVSDHLAVMHDGCIVETGAPDFLWRNPQHPHTRALVEAAAEFGLHT